MMRNWLIALGACLLVGSSASTTIAQRSGPTYANPARTDADFVYQGEYSGEVIADGKAMKVGVQVIALGNGQFRAVSFLGGLPGDGWSGEEKQTAEGLLENGSIRLENDRGFGEIKPGVIVVKAKEPEAMGTLRQVIRKSPTLGKKPPAGAVVLFDGSSAENFEGGRRTDDHLLMQGCTSKEVFGSHSVHIEFRLPYEPLNRGQGRGNSGIYLQGRYEVQMLDSFGLEGKNNECGGLYEIKDPDLNMCYPPLSWQTYDIDFTAAKFDGETLVAPPRITVRHNGVLIHDDVTLPGDRSTRAAPRRPGSSPGPIYLQDHHNPVRYRNIWVARTDS